MGDITYKCPTCGAPLVFKGATGAMSCEWCGSTFTPEQLKDQSGRLSENENQGSWEDYKSDGTMDTGGLTEYRCPQCGAEITADANAAAMECPFCGYPAIIAGAVSGMNKPDTILPFKIEKNDVEKALTEYYRGKKLLPDSFTKNNRVEKISGVYVPFWMFDCDADARIAFNASKVKRWSDNKYDYVKTDEYIAYRSGGASFEKIPVNADTHMQPDLMESIEPYDYKGLIPFESQYLAGYMADRHDIESKDSELRANERVKASVEEALKKETEKNFESVSVKDNQTRILSGNIFYSLLPVWLLSTKFENKTYTFAMNGQTGKMTGDLPVDMGKFWKWLALIFVVCGAVLSAAVTAVSFFRGTISAMLLPEIVVLIIAFLIALITVLVMKAGMKPVARQPYADLYMKQDSLKVEFSRDVLVNSRTTKTEKAKA